MTKMIYKTFVWPQNPHTYREEYSREPKYKTVDQVVYYDKMGPMRHIITGKGVFHGSGAYDQFIRLAALFKESTPGNLQHPIWGIRYCYFTGLELTQEPRDSYVSYSFTFTVAETNGTVPK